jgi:acetyl esterase/lipase
MPDDDWGGAFTYKKVGPLQIQADLYRRGGADGRPAILWFHGGALIMGSRKSLPPPALLERLLAAGYMVISADYRLAPETQLPGIVEDVEDAYAWLLSQGPDLFGIDPTRVAIAGMSAGGYLTLTAGFRLKPAPEALVSFYGYGDITGAWYTQPSAFYRERYGLVSREQGYKAVSGPAVSGAPTEEAMRGRPDFYLYCRQNGCWPQDVTGHDPIADAPWFIDYEPIRNVTPAYPPTLLLHGEKDTDVPFEQSAMMAAELRRQGVAHEFVSNPEWGHVFDHDENAPALTAAFDSILGFLAKHLA